MHEFALTWGGPEPVSRNYIFDAYGCGLVLNKLRFDRDLANAAIQRGAIFLTRARVRDVTRSLNAWELEIDQAGSRVIVRCGFLAICSGRSRLPPRVLAVRRQYLDLWSASDYVFPTIAPMSTRSLNRTLVAGLTRRCSLLTSLLSTFSPRPLLNRSESFRVPPISY